jgi:hypothetical protein
MPRHDKLHIQLTISFSGLKAGWLSGGVLSPPGICARGGCIDGNLIRHGNETCICKIDTIEVSSPEAVKVDANDCPFRTGDNWAPDCG